MCLVHLSHAEHGHWERMKCENGVRRVLRRRASSLLADENGIPIHRRRVNDEASTGSSQAVQVDRSKKVSGTSACRVVAVGDYRMEHLTGASSQVLEGSIIEYQVI